MEDKVSKLLLGVGIVAIVVLAIVAQRSVNVSVVTPSQDGARQGSLGTGFTLNTDSGSYTEGADLRQNVQALTERMSGLTQNQLLQVDSSGSAEAVAPSALAGVWEMYTTLETEAVTATATITSAESGNTFFMSGAAQQYTLPATSTADGLHYRFVVGGSLTGNATIVTSDGGDNIEGTLIVAGAVVDCDAEDTITFVADGENIGDYVDVYSDGTYWYIGDSGALTASKLTCSAT